MLMKYLGRMMSSLGACLVQLGACMQLHALACLLVVVARAGPAGEQCRPLCGIFVSSFFVQIPMYLYPSLFSDLKWPLRRKQYSYTNFHMRTPTSKIWVLNDPFIQIQIQIHSNARKGRPAHTLHVVCLRTAFGFWSHQLGHYGSLCDIRVI